MDYNTFANTGKDSFDVASPPTFPSILVFLVRKKTPTVYIYNPGLKEIELPSLQLITHSKMVPLLFMPSSLWESILMICKQSVFCMVEYEQKKPAIIWEKSKEKKCGFDNFFCVCLGPLSFSSDPSSKFSVVFQD